VAAPAPAPAPVSAAAAAAAAPGANPDESIIKALAMFDYKLKDFEVASAIFKRRHGRLKSLYSNV